ncbi:hypothetical protein MKW92_030755, partial [Papaver armeniacum]
METENNIPPIITISDDEVNSSKAPSNNPSSSSEYTPATPSPKTSPQRRLLFEDDPFLQVLYKSTGSIVTIGGFAIQDPTVARGIIHTGMLPADHHFYDRMTEIHQILDRAAQLHFA